MNIPILFSLPSCGKCQSLKSKLETAGIQFEVVEDVSVMRECGISGSIPVLSIDGIGKLHYFEALEYIRNR
jgi:glutaredoxin